MSPTKNFRTGPTTERLTHRPFLAQDAEVYFRLRSDPDIIRYTGDEEMQTVAEAEEAIANYPDFETVGYGRWACLLKSTGEVIGFNGLKYLPDIDATDVGYRLVPEQWGQGLATEACRASIEYGFTRIGLERIVGLVLPENTASIRVLEKSGLTFVEETDYDGFHIKLFEITSSDFAQTAG